MDAADTEQPELYALLGVPETATTKMVEQAFRRASKQCHPDKAGNDRAAAARFHQLQVAKATLCDPAARATYDQKLRAKHRRAARFAAMSEERKRKIAELNAKEEQAKRQRVEENRAKVQLAEEVEKFRREDRAAEERLIRESFSTVEPKILPATLKLTWRTLPSADAEPNDLTVTESLRLFCAEHGGQVDAIVLAPMKQRRSTPAKRTALVSFRSSFGAKKFASAPREFCGGTLHVKWVTPTAPPESPTLPSGAPSGAVEQRSLEEKENDVFAQLFGN